MSRIEALEQAVRFLAGGGNGDAATVVATAEVFSAFLSGAAPVVEAPAPKAAKPPKQPKVEAPPVVEEAAAAPDVSARVEEVIGAMLKANKRKEALGLLASFNDSKNKTEIVAQGAEVMAQFVEQAEAILLGA